MWSYVGDNKKCKISAKETTKYNDYMEANTKTQY